MDIIRALKQEEAGLEKKLTAVRSAIAALNGSHNGGAVEAQKPSKMSAAGRARIAAATTARWKRFRAEKAKARSKN